MQNQTQTFARASKRALMLALVVLTAFGALVADTVTKQRDYEGQIKLSLCGPDGKGGWQVNDSIAANLRFGFTVADLASGKMINSDFVWTGRTAKGASFRARLVGQGQASFNPANGMIEERLPIEVEVNGKKESFSMPLTTESVRTAIGPLAGRRAQINGNVGEMAVVGETILKQVNPFENAGAQMGKRFAAKQDNVAVVAELTGRVIAK